MGSSDSKQAPPEQTNTAPPEQGSTNPPHTASEPSKSDATGENKLKPCCACPETKQPRDKCIVEKGEENCGDLIEAHKECMRKLGFKV